MSNACFYCRAGRRVDGQGHIPDPEYVCLKNQPNAHLVGGIEAAGQCPQFDPRVGFQMGGYYTHMWFETDPITTAEEVAAHGPKVAQNRCLTWYIQGDGEFPIQDGDVEAGYKMLEFHLCDFRQLEDFIKFWGTELRKRGWIYDGDNGDSA